MKWGKTHLLKVVGDDLDTSRSVRHVRVLGAVYVALQETLVGLGLSFRVQKRAASVSKG